MAALQNKKSLRTLQIPGSKISHEGLIHLRNNLPVNVFAHIATFNGLKLVTLVHKDNNVHVDIYLTTPDDDALFTPLLEEDLPPELHGITVTTKSFMSKALLRSVGNSQS